MSRDSTNQDAIFVEWLSRLERAFFRGIYGEILALFQACVGNFDIIPPWKVVGTLYLDSSCITFKYFAFLSVCDKFELLGHVQLSRHGWFESYFRRSSWIYCWLLWLRLAVLSDILVNLLLQPFFFTKFCGLPGSTPVSFPVMRRWNCLGMKRSSQPSSTLLRSGKRADKTPRSVNRCKASNDKSGKSLFHFKPEKVNKFEHCNNLWKQNIFISQCGNSESLSSK